MAKILCAIRGGEASYRTQDAAIALAQERGDELLFLYVVDTTFLDRTERAFRRDTVMTEIRKMGEFLLEMAQGRAQEKGLKAQVVIREGKTRGEIKGAAKELQVNYVVLGLPIDGGVFQEESLRAFAREIEEETGAEVLLV